MMCLPFAVSQRNNEEWFDDKYISAKTDDSLLVFAQYNNKKNSEQRLTFMVASNKGETETFLRSQLDLLYNLLVLEYGYHALFDQDKIARGYFQNPKEKDRITRLVDTLCYLCDHNQSFLVQSTENLLPNTNSFMNDEITQILRNGTSSLPNVSHAILFVGTKQAIQYIKSQKNAMKIDSHDIYLLTIWFWSYFFSLEEMCNEGSDSDDDDLLEGEARKPKKERGKSTYSPIKVHRDIHLQSGSFSVYITQLAARPNNIMAPLILVLLSRDVSQKKASDIEKNKLVSAERAISESLLNTYAGYLLSIESTNSMISYIHYLPGLVHFILVERTDNRVTAPKITGMFGPDSPNAEKPLQVKRTIKILKSKIWEMCYISQEFLSRGYYSMVLKSGEFQYYYNLWFENNYGQNIPIKIPLESKRPLTHEFYKQLQLHMEQEHGHNIKCYELYALYLNFLPVKVVVTHSKTLSAKLLGKGDKY